MIGFNIKIPLDVVIPMMPTEMLCKEIETHIDQHQKMYALDMGCGSGIITLQIGKLGFRYVVAIDLNQSAIEATQFNWQQNGFSANDLVSIVSNGFNSIPTYYKGHFDIIVSNPPVQPTKYVSSHNMKRQTSFHWNESGRDGRHLLDNLLRSGPKWLKVGGCLFIATSSRHGWKETEQILSYLVKIQEISTWTILLEKEILLNKDQLKYVDYWLTHQSEEDIRVYKRNGHYYHTLYILKISK